MRLGASLFLIAVGAILKFAITDSVDKVDLGVVGIILMIVGAIGLLAEAIFWGTRRRTTVVHHEPPVVVGEPARASAASEHVRDRTGSGDTVAP